MNQTMTPTPLFRPSGAREVTKQYARRKSWVRPGIHYAIRWASFFFLRPWDGVVLPRRGKSHGSNSGAQMDLSVGSTSSVEPTSIGDIPSLPLHQILPPHEEETQNQEIRPVFETTNPAPQRVHPPKQQKPNELVFVARPGRKQ